MSPLTAEHVWWERLGRATRPPDALDETHRRIVRGLLRECADGEGIRGPAAMALWDELGEHLGVGPCPPAPAG